MSDLETFDSFEGLDVAIVGMAGRFPGARNPDEFWQNLRDGVESISFFSDEKVLASGVDSTELENPHYVKAGGVLEDVELFDAPFFGFYPREAEIIDPQHRVFLECAWEALENSGHAPESYAGLIGVYAGSNVSSYLLFNLLSNRGVTESIHDGQLVFGNDKDYLSTRVSYKLNLKGPSVNVQTACSTSLVAVHLACQGLLNYQCDMALAGGVSIGLPQQSGYLYTEGGILSPDGHCRAFDAKAQGTLGGNGVAIVVLKRLADALADGDYIHALIKGTAINNDGSLRVGYTAPSVEGQAKVIATAQALAGVDPQTISYVEAHGTGTVLGDPIEIAALTQVFRASTQDKGFCAIGSVKTNLGHLSAAAGVAGLIKTVLALKHRMLPPSLHFEKPNPKIDIENSPFYVNAALSAWKAPQNGLPRRAGVSSFGIGGTNAHAVLEQAPVTKPSGRSRPWQLLLLSAKTDSALETATSNLVQHLKQHPDLNLSDVAYTHQVGRMAFDHRRMAVCRDLRDTVSTLEKLDPQRVLSAFHEPANRPVTFMFSGLGDHYVNMALELYQSEPTFRAHLDRCSKLLKPHLGLDLQEVLYPKREQADDHARAATPDQGFDLRKMLRRDGERTDEHTQKLNQTFLTQPALFVIEYALAQLWIEWGIRPQAMIGYSIGEYVAACLAGVFSLENASSLVAQRAQMIHKLPGGAMLAVPLAETALQAFLTENLSLSAVNGPSLCVVSGPTEAVGELEHRLAEKAIACRRVQTSHAFHSKGMESIAEPLTELVKTFDLQPPRIPYVSNVTGTWITATEATDPSYWARHACRAVRFADGLGELLKEPARILLEIGPGRTLSTLVRQHPDCTREQVALSSVRHLHDRQSDIAFLLTTLGKLWLAGAQVDWSGFYTHERRQRLPLPTYPFERRRYWVEPQGGPYGTVASPAPTRLHKRPNIADWFYLPSWKRADIFTPFDPQDLVGREACWLVFDEGGGLGTQIVERLAEQDQDVVTVTLGNRFERLDDRTYTLNPREREDYAALIQALVAQDKTPETIVHLWNISSDGAAPSDDEALKEAQARGFYSLLFLAQALGRHNVTTPLQIDVVSTNLQGVSGEEVLRPEKATLLGPCRVIPQEYLNITCRSIDVVLPKSETPQRERLVDRLIAEFVVKPPDLTVAYRGNHRWVQIFEPLQWDGAPEGTKRLRKGGVYLITGGLGRIGLVLAEHLAQTLGAKLILVGRSAWPDRSQWAQWLATHDDQDNTGRKIRQVQALEALGAEVMVASADVADLPQMQGLIDRVYERFGALHGVIHGAGLVGEESMTVIQDTGRAEVEGQFQAKMRGTVVLEQILQGRELDFCILQSSLTPVLGGLGFVAYAAANCFMDAIAHRRNQTDGASWISVSQDGWRFDQEKDLTIASTPSDLGIAPEEGGRVFEYVLSLGFVPHVVVSTGDLQARIEQWVQLEPLELAEEVDSTARHLRPDLPTTYVPPHNALQETIVAMWQKVLGIEQVGVHDEFFELGGHSLLATQLISRLRDTFQVELSLRDFFEMPTVAGLAESIETFRWAAQDLQAHPRVVADDREGGEL
jgi:acyl transferase domain-containing protein